MTICVYGASSRKLDKKYEEACYNLAKAFGERGHNLVFGAGGDGLMGAAARGFYDAGAKVHGVIPRFFEENGYEGIFKGAEKITRTETMAERKQIMEDNADAFVILPGGIGTFEEFFQALTLKQLGRHKKAIALFNCFGFFDNLNKFIDEIIEMRFVNEGCKMLYKTFDKAEEIIDYVENYTAEGVRWDFLKRN